MAALMNAVLAARPIGSSAPPIIAAPKKPTSSGTTILPPAVIPPIGARGGGSAAAAPAAEAPRRGRPTKEERVREARKAMSAAILEFAESKPSKRAVREFFRMRISQLNDAM